MQRCHFSCKSDDVFPSISDILGLKPDYSKVNPKSSIPHTPEVLTHLRAPLRATTFDGNPFFISRKPRIVTLRKVRDGYPSLSLLTQPLVVFDIANGKLTRGPDP